MSEISEQWKKRGCCCTRKGKGGQAKSRTQFSEMFSVSRIRAFCKRLCVSVFKLTGAGNGTKGVNVSVSAGSKLASNDVTSVIKIEVEGRGTKALVDSGSCCTLMSETFWRLHVGLRGCKLDKQGLVDTFSVNGELLELLGSMSVRVKMGQHEFYQKVFVAKQLPTPVLVGWDAMLQQGMVVDGAGGFLEVHGCKVPLLSRDQAYPQSCFGAVFETAEVPGRSEVVVTAEIQGSEGDEMVPDGFAGLLEPNRVFHNEDGLMVARTISVVTQGRALVRVMNVASDSVVLHKGIPLGFFQATGNSVVARLGRERESVGVRDQLSMPQTGASLLPSELIGPMVEGSSLSWGERKLVMEMLGRRGGVFSRNDADIGRTRLVQHTIDVGESRPIRQVPRRVPINYREEVERQTKEMLAKGVVEESVSPWSSPVILVKKKDGSLRYCVDYRQLNDCTKKDAHPLPRIDDCLDALCGAKFFSVMDLTSGYWQVEVAAEDREKTAFSVESGLFQFNVMPFGLSNAPATFQRLMQMVLAGIQ